jgi:flagellar export protein FliJ
MGFRFAMASVLRFRESIEKREELALQKIQLEVSQVGRYIDELTKALAKASDERDEALRDWMQAYRLKDLQDEMKAAVETKQSLCEMLAKLKSQHDRQMKIYQTARANRRMLTDLQKQQRETWDHEQARIEQKTLDDLFTSRMQRS